MQLWVDERRNQKVWSSYRWFGGSEREDGRNIYGIPNKQGCVAVQNILPLMAVVVDWASKFERVVVSSGLNCNSQPTLLRNDSAFKWQGLQVPL